VLELGGEEVVAKVVRLRAVLPGANISDLVLRRPQLLTQDSVAAVEGALRQLQRLMPGYDLTAPGKLTELHVWQNFVSCLSESHL